MSAPQKPTGDRDRDRAVRKLALELFHAAGVESVRRRTGDNRPDLVVVEVAEDIESAYGPGGTQAIHDLLAAFSEAAGVAVALAKKPRSESALPADDFAAGLRKLVGGSFANVHPDAYVREIRGDDAAL